MQKTLKVLAALGIMSCVAYVVAQTGEVRARGTNGALYSPGQGGGVQIASKEGESRYAPANGAQKALREYIMAVDNRNVELAHRDNRNGVAQACVEVQCYYMLATMKPDERKHEVDDVWQVNQYRPNGQWNHITSAPILVDSLLRIDKKTSAAIDKVVEADREAWFAPFQEQAARVAKHFPGKKWDTMTDAEKKQYMELSNIEREKWRNGRTTADISSEHAKFVTGTMKKVKALLSKSEAAEFDRFLAAYDKDMATTFTTGTYTITASGSNR